MVKWSKYVRDFGTAAAPTVQGFKDLGFALVGELPTILEKYLRVDVAQGFDNTEKAQGRTNLGIGTIATQAANAVAITGGTITGITDLAIADGGTGASTAAQARTNLGLAIGSNVQAYGAGLQSIAGLTTSANLMIYTTASNAYATTALTAFARTVLDDADAATMRGTIGADNAANLTTGTIADARLPTRLTESSLDATYLGISAKAADSDKLNGQVASYYLSIGNMTGTVPIAQGGTGATTAAAARTNLGLAIGSNVQAYDAGLAALAAFATNGFIARTGTDTFAGRTLTGTANQITVTNGDGVAGDPTITLPNALTFTGKTITGGSYASPALTGTPTAPTAGTGDNSTKIATTAFVRTAVADSGIFTQEYVSAEQTITPGGALTLPHGLTTPPKIIFPVLICKTAENGYSVGDIVPVNPSVATAANNDFGASFEISGATNILVRYGSAAQAFLGTHKTTGALVGMASSNWRLIMKAYA